MMNTATRKIVDYQSYTSIRITGCFLRNAYAAFCRIIFNQTKKKRSLSLRVILVGSCSAANDEIHDSLIRRKYKTVIEQFRSVSAITGNAGVVVSHSHYSVACHYAAG